ncbi:META domain-containing protein [Streptomyces sp. NPDC058855]|uniref:META domain-containing protein n=1 Tax=Streptomyces sp. NPDC058855 TaxID=3346651 RepID=UPI0036CB8AB9
MQKPRTLAAAALVLLLAACGTEGGDGGPGAGPAAPDLPVTGTHWTIESVTVDGTRFAAPDGARLDFAETGRAKGDSGCNHFGAAVAVNGDTLTVSSHEVTARGCPADRERFESVLLKAFSGKLNGRLDGEDLTLTSADGRGGVELTREPSAPLRGTTWKIDGLVSGTTAASLPAGSGDKARMVIGADGRITGNLGCNNFSATARADGRTLTVEGPAATTRMICTSPQMSLETKLYELLDGPLTYRLDHRTLTLTDASGEGFTARAESPGRA